MQFTPVAYSALLLLLVCGVTHAKNVMISASRDNTIFENAPNNSGGGMAGIFAGTNSTPSKRRGLIAFDVAANVPSGSTITSVELRLYLGLSPNASSQAIGLYRLTADWGEGTSGSSTPTVGGLGNGAPAAVGDATWTARNFGSNPWSNPGATGDFDAAASAVANVGGPPDSPHTWESTTGLVSDVQSWLDSPGSNFGWALINANEVNAQTFKAFYSRSATLNSENNPLDPSFRPTLTVTYIPEPTAGGLTAFAPGLLLAVHRRRGFLI
jgi:hypothetical protein